MDEELTCQVAVNDLLGVFRFTSECVIEQGSDEIEALVVGQRITAINGEGVISRSELRDALLECEKKGVSSVAVSFVDGTNPLEDDIKNLSPHGRQSVASDCGNQLPHFQPIATPKSQSGRVFELPAFAAESEHDMSVGGSFMGAMEPIRESPTSAVTKALTKVLPGRCVIVLYSGTCPSITWTSIAEDTVIVDVGVSFSKRPSNSVLLQRIASGIGRGATVVIIRASNSIGLLQELAKALQELHHGDTAKAPAATADDNAPINALGKILLVTESHPHFPQPLLEKCVMMRFFESSANDSVTSDVFAETLRDLPNRIKLAQNMNPEGSFSSYPQARKVRIGEAQLYQIAAIEHYNAAASVTCLWRRTLAHTEQGHLALRAETNAMVGDKYTCLSFAGTNRVAAASSNGNVSIFDTQTYMPVFTFRTEANCVWDIDFESRDKFVTACENGNIAMWTHRPGHPGFFARNLYTLKTDAFCCAIRCIANDSIVLAGGLGEGSLVACNGSAGPQSTTTIQNFQTTCSTLSLSWILSTKSMFASGFANGEVGIWDIHRNTPIRLYHSHRHKVPGLATNGNLVCSTSFDGSIVLYDTRAENEICTIEGLHAPVTGVAMRPDGGEIVACVGESIVSFDVGTGQEQYRRRKSWKGLTRGCLFSDHQVVTAASDGLVRFFDP